MVIERAYTEPFSTILIFKDCKPGTINWKRRTINELIFPSFLKEDFSTFEGYRSFISEIGISGLTYLDAYHEKTNPYPLERELNRLMKEQRPLPVHIIKKFYDRFKNLIIKERTTMQLFHEWFFKGEHPLIHKIGPGPLVAKKDENKFPPLCAPVLTVYVNALKRGWIPKDDKERKLIESLKELLNTVHKHFKNNVQILPVITSGCLNAEMITGCSHKIHADPRYKNLKSRSWLSLRPYFRSLPARCYAEMIDLVEDKKEVRYCAHCRLAFIPSRKDQEFCDRNAPEYYDWPPWKDRKTCKDIGPQVRYRTNDPEYIRQRKQFLNRLYYLKGIGKTNEYKKVMAEFKRWQKQNLKSKGG